VAIKQWGSTHDDLKLDRLVIDKLQIAVEHVVSRKDMQMIADNLRVHSYPSYLADHVTFWFTSFVANVSRHDTEETELYSYPATPWDFIKENFAPAWFLKRWPVEYVSKKVPVRVTRNFMCPHLSVPDTFPHVFWMKENLDLK
jgi:hypothetical protein